MGMVTKYNELFQFKNSNVTDHFAAWDCLSNMGSLPNSYSDKKKKLTQVSAWEGFEADQAHSIRPLASCQKYVLVCYNEEK